MSTTLPANRNARLAEHWLSDEESKTPPEKLNTPVFPLIIFSHGLGGINILPSTLGHIPDELQVRGPHIAPYVETLLVMDSLFALWSAVMGADLALL
jgi:hypothetical protein